MTEECKPAEEVEELKRELATLTEACNENFQVIQTVLTDFKEKIEALYGNFDYLKEIAEGTEEPYELIIPN